MKVSTILVTGAILASAGFYAAAADSDAPAPAFTLTDVEGTEHSLSDFEGKTVVLEWTNYDCPFVKKHYSTGNMQALQKRYTDKGVVWLSICSSAPGKQGHYTPETWRQKIAEQDSQATAVLLDETGLVGRRYGAKTTPHLFVIDGTGVLRYQGAIDDNRSWDPQTVTDAANYVAAALDALLEGKPVAEKDTPPYGCSVKY
ncbi:MAG: thioredoxin family protein [Phycisphaerae bacterium]|nr:thioredoxin family protein [Phycisphaerae bacterium]